jgi:teichuronic acid biosynthesis glycosyltransferase TuaC
MRVLVVTNAYPDVVNQSVGIFVKEQVESLQAVGVDVTVLHIDRTKEGRSAYRKVPARLRDALVATTPDLVHVMYGGVMAQIVARTLDKHPLVVSFCGNDLFGEGNAKLHQRWIGRYAVHCSHRAARSAAGIVVKSRGLFAALPSGVDPGRVWVLPNGVDLDRFAPEDANEARAELGWSLERKHVLFPAAASRTEKRFGLARAGVDEVRATGIDVELHVLDGVRRADVPRWLNASDAILLTSTHEGSPNVVKEALACNVAVVSVDVGDVRERIDGVDGSFLADATPVDLGRKLSLALEAGRPESRSAVAELSHHRVAERLRDAYVELLQGPEA